MNCSVFAVMTGQLLQPSSYDPVTQLLTVDQTRARLDQIRSAVRASADYMPGHNTFIAAHCAA
jgi:tryptophan halogenase